MRTTTTSARILTIGAGLLLTAAGCTNPSGGQGSGARPGAGTPGAPHDAGVPKPRPFVGDGGSPLPGSNGGASSGTATGGGPSVCLPDPSDDACSTCLKSSCCDVFAACAGDAPCVALIQCGNGCAAGDSSCGAQCVSSYPPGQSPALALIGCEQDSCASACGSAAPPPSSGGQPGACLPDSAVPPGSPDCASLADTPVERDCPFGSPDTACVAAPGGAANVFCCPSGVGGLPATGGPTPAPGGHGGSYVDPQAVGLWQKASTSGVDFTNGSGSFSSPSGTKAIFEFTADGQYLFETFFQSSLYSCTMALLGRETGSVTFHGTGFTLAPAMAKVTSQDSCNVSNNYQKPWQNRLDGPFEYTWSVGPDPNGSGRRVLSVTYLADGSSETLLEQPPQ